MSWVQMGIGGLNALLQIQGGRTAQGQANLRGHALDLEAKREQEDALQTAEIIRRAGRRQVGQTVTAYAGAGVRVGEGSALEVERQVEQDVAHDAFQAILNGDRRAIGLRTDAKMARSEGRAMRTAGYVNASGTLLAAGANAMQGWKSARYSYNNDEDGAQFSRSGSDIRGRR